MRNLSPIDHLLGQCARQVSLQFPVAAGDQRRLPESAARHLALDSEMSAEERQRSGALMRVNHVGEICAQALYSAQSLTASDAQLRSHFKQAAAEELTHLDWTASRLAALGTHPSYLNPVWASGAFGLGLLAGAISDQWSLGFVVETERQVEQHLASHLALLPEHDLCSREVVSLMKQDEADHAQAAQALGAKPIPRPVASMMRLAAKVMTTVAYRI